MPSTRARTSAVRVAGTRPGSSTTLGIGCDLTVMTSTSGGGGAGAGLSEHPANMSRAAPSAAPRRFLKYLAECIDILPDTELTYNALQRLRDGQVAAVSLSIDTAPITGFSTAECNISYNSTYFQKDNQSETIL